MNNGKAMRASSAGTAMDWIVDGFQLGPSEFRNRGYHWKRWMKESGCSNKISRLRLRLKINLVASRERVAAQINPLSPEFEPCNLKL